MANTEYKLTLPARAYEPASSLAASHPSPLKREAFARAGRSQDSVLSVWSLEPSAERYSRA